MKVILTPTDFSENSWVAIQYAAKLANAINAKLKIVHIYQSFYSAFAGERFNTEVNTYTTDLVDKQMKALISKLQLEVPTVSVDGHCIEGVLHNTITQLLKKDHYDLIVMGTSGASGLKSIMGSNTLDIINLSTVPVLAVPEETTFEGFNKISLLSNFKEEEIDVLSKAITLIPSPRSLTLLHVLENHDESEEVMLRKWREIIESKVEIATVGHDIGIGDDLPAVINSMIDDKKTDLLIVTNNEKTFFKALFNRNLVRSIALSPQIPILFIKPES